MLIFIEPYILYMWRIICLIIPPRTHDDAGLKRETTEIQTKKQNLI